MLTDKERRLSERRLAEQGKQWFQRIGGDWMIMVLGLVMLLLAFARENTRGWTVVFAFIAGANLAIGAVRLLFAADQRLLAKLYADWKRREEPPGGPQA